jgi:D-alanyl-D-alanine-carboxypeptidase/D-alanyl-D-alanine-endopeptidase
MAWSTDAARPLAEAFNGALGAPGTVIAVACIDDAETVIQVNPGDTPAGGRFEVGSVTKTMTATLLALLAADGSLRLDDEVGRWLPAGANAGITVRQLATHTSGLPRLAPNMSMPTVDLVNPYAEFGVEQAEEGLRQAVAAPGAPMLYSNFGYQLLGLVLERASGLPYEQLITDRLLTPLGMSRSGVGSNAGGIPLPGHDHRGELPHWDHPLAAAGGVEATIGDLARYTSACLRPPPSPLGAAITAAQTPRLPVEAGGHQALAWRVSDDGIRWHTGSTGGFSAAVLIDAIRGRAIAMLASCFGRGQSLRQAGLLTLAGEDPRAARPQPPGPEWDERAREIIRLLLDGRAAEIQARAAGAVRERMFAERLDLSWRDQTRDLGPPVDFQVSCWRSDRGVMADTTITFANGSLGLRIGFVPSGQVSGMSLLSLPR